ncbi:acetylserotonin O-methyltransferase [Georgenia satyanarayanai]|uniref:acetylserotonin O-methyltransferase n=1 Tax=Georgenia satyanarayanai TaxID=860221 RepID=UPI001D008AF0|nr:acetylserotonin O-methyltransferase [Georgenia satyanarayanai]
MSRVPPTRLARAATSVRTTVQHLAARMVPPEVGVLELGSGFMSTHALYAAARLGVPDTLAAGPLSPADVAARVGTQPDATHRLLRACATWGVFREEPDGRFALTPLADRLRSGTADSMRDVVLMLGDPRYQRVWAELAATVRTGEPGAERALGRSMWEVLEQDAEFGDVFHAAMTRLCALDWPAVAAVYDFTRFSRVVDVGGGHGQLLALVLGASPAAQGVLVERPSMADGAARLLGEAGLGGRYRFEAASFFDSVPPDGDVYLLRRVLHDYDDAGAAAVLTTLRAHMRERATLLVLDGVVPSGNAPHLTKALDLDMMLFVGGRERTEPQWRALLADTGFRTTRIVPTVSPISVIEAVPGRKP